MCWSLPKTSVSWTELLEETLGMEPRIQDSGEWRLSDGKTRKKPVHPLRKGKGVSRVTELVLRWRERCCPRRQTCPKQLAPVSWLPSLQKDATLSTKQLYQQQCGLLTRGNFLCTGVHQCWQCVWGRWCFGCGIYQHKDTYRGKVRTLQLWVESSSVTWSQFCVCGRASFGSRIKCQRFTMVELSNLMVWWILINMHAPIWTWVFVLHSIPPLAGGGGNALRYFMGGGHWSYGMSKGNETGSKGMDRNKWRGSRNNSQ